MIDMIILKKEKGLEISAWYKHNKSVFYMLIRSLGVYSNFKLLNKQEPENITEQKRKTISILNQLKFLTEDKRESPEERDFFDSQVVNYFKD